LRLPPPNASFRKRVKAFQELRIKKLHFYILVDRRTGQTLNRVKRPSDWYALELGNGEKVYNIKDLTPLVPPDSKTARSIRNYKHNSRVGALSFGIGIPAAGVIGTGVMIAGLFQKDTNLILPIFGVGVAVFLGGMIGSTVMGFVHKGRAHFYRGEIITSYHPDLLKKLQIKIKRMPEIGGLQQQRPTPGPSTEY
tara:strand:- start:7309 stop:7893 length:585 start_codon:yes stop_codon:yes gene_type:complete